jgi:hypothetical protein
VKRLDPRLRGDRWVDGLMGRGVAGKSAKAAGGRRKSCRKIAGNGIFLINSWAARNAILVTGGS